MMHWLGVILPHDDPSWTARLVTILVAAVGAMVLARIAIAVVRYDRRRHGPTVRRLLKGCRLVSAERRTMHRLARVAGLTSPGSLVLSEGCFAAAVARYVARFGPDPALAALREKVFGDTSAEPGTRRRA